MQDPATQADLKAKVEAMKEDPEAGELLKELEAGGPAAMAACAAPPSLLSFAFFFCDQALSLSSC